MSDRPLLSGPDRLAWRWRRFDELDVHELQAVYMARQRVFVVEQACVYADADGIDSSSWHLAGWLPGSALPLAYARVVHPGINYPEPSIGRVLTLPDVRGSGLGRALMLRAIAATQSAYPGQGIRISAQSRLQRFYEELGFAVSGEPYLEDGILHTEMLRPAGVD